MSRLRIVICLLFGLFVGVINILAVPFGRPGLVFYNQWPGSVQNWRMRTLEYERIYTVHYPSSSDLDTQLSEE